MAPSATAVDQWVDFFPSLESGSPFCPSVFPRNLQTQLDRGFHSCGDPIASLKILADGDISTRDTRMIQAMEHEESPFCSYLIRTLSSNGRHWFYNVTISVNYWRKVLDHAQMFSLTEPSVLSVIADLDVCGSRFKPDRNDIHLGMPQMKTWSIPGKFLIPTKDTSS